MKRFLIFLFFVASLFELSAQQRRIALVIGNGDYQTSGSLKNPVNDAELMSATLESLDFTVIKKINADKQEMEKVIYEFSRKLNDYNVALFYYAGHGIQVSGNNFLLPTDAVLEDKVAAEFEAINVSKVVSQFERYPGNTNIVILDACRNNPFKSFSRGSEAGFTAIPAPSGTIIAYATGEGATASDGSGGNGLYTSVLASEMKKKQRIEDVFISTRVKVQDMSDGKQSPQEWSQLTGKFYFAGTENSEGINSAASTALASVSTTADQSTSTGNETNEIALDRGKISSGGYSAKVHITDLLGKYTIKQVLELGVPSSFMAGIDYKGGIIVEVNKEESNCLIVAKTDQNRGSEMSWEEAKNLCEFHQTDEVKNWRLPNRDELNMIYESLKSKNYGDFTDQSYWSSSKSGYSNAWGVSFGSGRNYDFDKLSSHHARAVALIPLD